MGLVVPLKERFKAYDQSEPLNSLINVHGFTKGGAFWTKSGSCGVLLRYRGVDPECLEPEALDSITALMDNAHKAVDENSVVRQYLFKSSRPELPIEAHSNRVVERAINNRLHWLRKKADSLYSFETFLVLERKPKSASARLSDRLLNLARTPRRTLRQALSVRERLVVLDAAFEQNERKLWQETESFLERSADCISGKVLKQEEAFLFLRRLLNPDAVKASAVRLARPIDLDFQIASSELECYRDHLRLGGYFVKPLTLKDLPGHTFSRMLKDLYRVQADFIAVSEWCACDPVKAIADIRSRRRHWHNTKLGFWSQVKTGQSGERDDLIDDSKLALVEDLGRLLRAIEMDGVRLGNFTFTVLALGRTLDEARRASAEMMKVFGTYEASLHEETYNGLNAFLATLPGGYPFNLRSLLLASRNYNDMSFWFLPSEGQRENPFTGQSSLIVLETEDGSLFHLDHHVEDVGHILALGRTGAGKSFLLSVLATHAQKYGPYTFIFDVGGSYRWLTELLGGSYIRVRPDSLPFDINIFILPPTPENLAFIFAFVKLLIESGGYRMNDADERDLFEAIRSIYVLDREQRCLLTLSMTVRKALGNHLKRWTRGEQYPMFDNVRDTVTFSRYCCVDFEGMEKAGVVLEALLFYLLHRANDIIRDEALSTTFKLFIVDEAWRFFKHEVTRAYIIEALKTWRKKNAAMILATQSIEDLDAEVLRPVAEACPTKLLLANPNMDATLYSDVLRLSPTEQEKVRQLVPKRQFLLKRDQLSKVLNINVDPESYWLFTTNPNEAKRRQELADEVGLEAALQILAGGGK